MSSEPIAVRGPGQPRVRANDWRPLVPPSLGNWTPTKSVTVVIPAFNSSRTLAHTLASLAAQSYPEHLLEVVVADDGGSPPVTLPPVRPPRTRVTVVTKSWGRAAACHHGAAVSDSDVIFWLDSDMLLHHDHVEAHLRWHHLLDYAVVLGDKTFIDPAQGLPEVEAVQQALAERTEGDLFGNQWSSKHVWVEELYDRTEDLAAAGERAYMAHVGAAASVNRSLYLDSGGFDRALKLGEDIELGYRLSQAGAVFIPERRARSWHLGRSTVMQYQQEVNRYNEPFLVDRVSQLRRLRQSGFRMYAVPYVEVVIDTRGHDLDAVKTTVDAVLSGAMRDVRCLLLGDWSILGQARFSPLRDENRESRLIAATYASERRVHLVTEVPESAFPAAFRATLPVGWPPRAEVLTRITTGMNKRAHSLQSILMPDGSVARFERTSAVRRVERIRTSGEDQDDLLDEVGGSSWYEGLEEGFGAEAPPTPAAARSRASADRRSTPPAPPEASDGVHIPAQHSGWWHWTGIERRRGVDRRRRDPT